MGETHPIFTYPPLEHVEPNDDQVPLAPVKDMFSRENNGKENESSWREGGADEFPQDMLNEIYEEASYEPSQSLHGDESDDATLKVTNSVDQTFDKGCSVIATSRISEAQRARMELNRLKALEKAAARAHS